MHYIYIRNQTKTFKDMVASKFNRSQISKSAWNLVKTQGFTLSQAMKQAWAEEKAPKQPKKPEDLTIEEIKTNLGTLSTPKVATEVYMLILVEKHYKRFGKKWISNENFELLKKYPWEDIDENGIGADGFDYLMDESDIKKNNENRKMWGSIAKKAVTLAEAFELLVLEGK